LFVGDAVANRPDVIRITVDGSTDLLIDDLRSSDGPQWDTLIIPITIPAGATFVRVRLFSQDLGPLTTQPDSLIWVTAALSISPEVVEEGACLLLIDEDTIDNDIKSIENISFNSPFCGDGDPAVCVNDDIADPGVRTPPLFTRGNNITPFSGLVLPTGQVGDWGLFMFTNPDPQVSLQNGATFTIAQFINATGAAANENNLDKIDGVVPLGAAGINALESKQCCAVVYDSDISVDVAQGFANLKGATKGLTAFEVTAVGPNPPGSVLPPITVNLLPSGQVDDVCNSVVPPQE
jgi:hypothetical protein